MKPKITTHVLNLEQGKPAKGITVSLFNYIDGQWQLLDQSITDDDGRISDWLQDKTIDEGQYKLEFASGEYFEKQQLESLYPSITISFLLKDSEDHYHIPVLLTRHSYSTYRGS